MDHAVSATERHVNLTLAGSNEQAWIALEGFPLGNERREEVCEGQRNAKKKFHAPNGLQLAIIIIIIAVTETCLAYPAYDDDE